jgi:signal transduction histidine kinase
MNPRNQFRFPWVDASILLAMLFIGWAAFRLAKLEPQIAGNRQLSRELPGIFKECHDLFRDSIEKPERARREFDLVWHEAARLKAEYLGIADRLQSDLPELDIALRDVSTRTDRGDLQRRMRELKSWMEKEKDRAGLERLDVRSEELTERIAGAQVSSTNGRIVTKADLIVDLYWRTVVMPLRIKLVQRETIIAHQEKLANFEQLAAGLAHEIRNPLTTINARLYTVQRTLPEGTPEHEDANVIRNEIGRVNQILKDFIQLTRPAPPNLVLMTARLLLKEVSDLMAPQLQQQAVRLACQSQGQAQFDGDAQQLKQVLINLIQNAAQSIGRDGLITLRDRDGSAILKGTQTKVAIIEVEDNRPGIRPEVQGRLFDPFFSTRKGGTGLGLTISARIIDRHGGRLDFETQAGQGTVFRITRPAYEKE